MIHAMQAEELADLFLTSQVQVHDALVTVSGPFEKQVQLGTGKPIESLRNQEGHSNALLFASGLQDCRKAINESQVSQMLELSCSKRRRAMC